MPYNFCNHNIFIFLKIAMIFKVDKVIIPSCIILYIFTTYIYHYIYYVLFIINFIKDLYFAPLVYATLMACDCLRALSLNYTVESLFSSYCQLGDRQLRRLYPRSLRIKVHRVHSISLLHFIASQS